MKNMYWESNNRNGNERGAERENSADGKQSSKGRIAGMVALIVFMLVLNALGCVMLYFDTVIDKIQFDSAALDNYTVTFTDIEENDRQEGVEYNEIDADKLGGDLSAMTMTEEELVYQENTTNVLLIGTDNRLEGYKGNSDAMILLTINRNTEQLVMTSIMRDLAVTIEGSERAVEKLTHAYVYGKAGLLIDTIEAHLGVRIDEYAAVDFYTFIDIVDYIGGIELDITESERAVMNDYVQAINNHYCLDYGDGFLWKTGENITVTGKQALGYARNRYSYTGNAGGDYGRTERQREVLSKIIEKIKANPTLAFGLIEKVAPYVTTSYEKDEMMAEVMNLAEYAKYEIVEFRVPAADTYENAMVGNMSVVSCDFAANRKLLIEKIYGVEDVE